MNKKKEIDRQELYRLYVEDKLLLKDIQKIFNVSKNTLDKRFIEYGISKRNNKKIFEVSKEELYDLYINKNMTAFEIAKVKNTTQRTIEKRLRKYNIKKSKVLFYKKNKEILLERYGVDNVSQLKNVKEKKKKKSIEKYGVENISQAKIVKEKKQQKALDKFGVTCVLQSEEIKDKCKKTILKKYGVDNINKVKEVREKSKKTMLKKYGVESPGKVKEFRIKAVRNGMSSRSRIDNKRFDSSYERDFYDYCLRNGIKVEDKQVPIEYEYKKKKHITFIDFKVNDKLIECKGGHLLQGVFDYTHEVPIEVKLDLYEQYNVILITDKKGINIIKKYPIHLIVEDIENFRKNIDKNNKL